MVKISWDYLAVGFLLSPFFFSSHALNLFFWHFHMQYTLKKPQAASFTCFLLLWPPTPDISLPHLWFCVLFCDLLCLTKHVCITWGLLVFISFPESGQQKKMSCCARALSLILSILSSHAFLLLRHCIANRSSSDQDWE